MPQLSTAQRDRLTAAQGIAAHIRKQRDDLDEILTEIYDETLPPIVTAALENAQQDLITTHDWIRNQLAA